MSEINFGKSEFQFAQLDEKLEPRIASLFNQTAGCNVGIKSKLDWREVILMDIQSTMYIFWNRYLAENTTKSKTKIRLKSNVSTIIVSHQATMNSYHRSVWFSEDSITNIIALRNLRLQYLVTYRSNEIILIVHRESEGKPNMQFRIH